MKSAFDAQDITLTGELPTNVNVGDYVTVPTASVTGGDGYSQIRIKAQVGGHEIEIQNQRFQAIYEGDYAIVYEVTDWNGETASKTITLPNVTYSNEPRFEEDDLFLPSAFIAGQSYSLKTYTASLFVKGEDAPRSIPASVEVTDGDGTRTLGSDLVYVPKTSSTVSEATLRFRFDGLEGAFTEITKVIPIRSIKRSSGFMANYFYGNEGTNVTAKDEGVYCKRKALGLCCDHPLYESCLANLCPHYVFTSEGVPALARVIRHYAEKAQRTGDKKYEAALRKCIIPAFQDVLNDVIREMSGAEKASTRKLLEEVLHE